MNYYCFDSHCDTVSRILDEQEPLSDNTGHVSIRKMREYKGFVQFFAAFIDPDLPNPLQRCLSIIDKLYEEADKYSANVAIVRNYAQMLAAREKGKIAAFIPVEGGEAVIGDLAVLRTLYRLGVRSMTLTWNYSNQIATGVLGKNQHLSHDDLGKLISSGAIENSGGLTEFGREVVKEMNRLGMVVDVSHISPDSFYDVAELSTRPFIASHSNAKAICPHVRNLDDDQFKTIVKAGGMVGLNFCPAFLHREDFADVNDMLRHIEHFLSLGGENHIGLGADFDGIDSTPIDVTDVSKLDILRNALLRQNYSEELTDKIFFKNYFTFVKNNF